MASEKKYPVRMICDDAGNESAGLNLVICKRIAAEPVFKGKSHEEIAEEYIKRAAAEDPDLEATFEIDHSKGLFIAQRLPETTNAAERKRIVDQLNAKGFDAEIRKVGDIKK